MKCICVKEVLLFDNASSETFLVYNIYDYTIINGVYVLEIDKYQYCVCNIMFSEHFKDYTDIHRNDQINIILNE